MAWRGGLPRKQQLQQQSHAAGAARAGPAGASLRRTVRPANTSRDAAAETGPGRQEWLAKVLAAAGVASRRACIDLVKQGQVTVNGVRVDDPATKVDAGADVLAVGGRPVRAAGGRGAAPRHHYLALHKPPGYICSDVSSKPGLRAVDLLRPWLDAWRARHPQGELPPRLFCVGRLDVQTSGLLLMTNDGDWANRVIHPSAGMTKEYWATVRAAPTQQQLQQLRAGTVMDGVRVTPVLVKVLQRQQAAGSGSSSSSRSGGSSRSDGSSSSSSSSGSSSSSRSNGGSAGSSSSSSGSGGRCVLRLDVVEGKKHEVRLLVASAGLELLQLKRVRVGGLLLPDDLRPGQYMELTPRMRERVFEAPPPPSRASRASSSGPSSSGERSSSRPPGGSRGGRGAGASGRGRGGGRSSSGGRDGGGGRGGGRGRGSGGARRQQQ